MSEPGLDIISRVLIVEDSEDHIALIKHELNRLDINVEILEASNGLEAEKLINEEPFNFDIIILDYSLPEKSGLEILNRIREISSKVQVLLTTGMGSEKVAADALRLGANDYIIKEENFVPKVAKAVLHAIEKIQLQKTLQLKDEELRLSELKYRTLINQANDGILIINNENKIEEVNQRLLEMTKNTQNQLIGSNWTILLPESEIQRVSRLIGSGKVFDTLVKKGDEFISVDISARIVPIPDGEEFVFMVLRDITETKHLQNILKEQTERLETKWIQEKGVKLSK